MSPHSVEVVSYTDDYRQDFERLNCEWIQEYFALEDADREVFGDPVGKIIAPGGQVFFVCENGEPKGTCAVLRQSATTFELAKMAVTKSARGRGYGELLMRAALDFAVEAGAQEIVLSSNSKLQPALRLYEKFGFRSITPSPDARYERVDVMMRLTLPNKNN